MWGRSVVMQDVGCQCRVGVLCFARCRLLMWGRSVVMLDVGC